MGAAGWQEIQDRRYVSRNIEARSCNHFCSGKAIIITYSECVFLARDIQHAMRMLWPTRLNNIFFPPLYLRNSKFFGGKKVFESKISVSTYINNCPTRWNTKQSVYYSASLLYTFRVSTTPIIRSTQNCNYSLRYWSYILCSYLGLGHVGGR